MGIRKVLLLYQVVEAEPVSGVTDTVGQMKGWGWYWNWAVQHESNGGARYSRPSLKPSGENK